MIACLSSARIRVTAAALFGASLPSLAIAQAQPADTLPPKPATAAASAEDIVVTGTRIRGLDPSGAVPVSTITRDTIVESGATTLIEVLRDLPAANGGGATFSTATAGPLSGDTPVGASAVSLRALGVSSTLTLINGRRAQVAAFARGTESFIDASSIPLAAVERVEVLPSGASAIYGADAIAGVVNYVLRKDFQGFEISGSYGDSTAKTDESRVNLSAVGGFRIGENRFMVVIDYFKRNPFFLRDRAISARSVRPSQQGFYPSFNDLFAMRNDQTESPANGGCPATLFKTGNLGEYCEVDNNNFVSANDRLETIGGLFTHQLDLGAVTWYNDVLYQRTESRGVSSPANFSRAPSDPENPNYPQSFRNDLAAEAGFSRFSSFNRFPIFMWGKLLEPRAVEVTSDSFRVTSGFRGDLGGDWKFDAAVLYGGNDRTQKGLSGLVVAKNFYDLNLGNICTDGSSVRRWDVNLVRPSATYRGATCEQGGKTTLWYNPFNGQASQAAGVNEFLNTQAERRGRSRLFSVDASANGTLFEMPAGPVKAAVGAEFRRETVSDVPSGVAVATSTNPEPILGFSSTSAEAKRNSWAIYAEAYVPLADGLDLQLAGRYDWYQGFGGAFNPKVAARWAPTKWLSFRGNFATSFRAPSLAQSGAGVLLSSYTVRCAITPQACNGSSTANGQALLSEDVGNANLNAEKATSFGGGVMIEPNRDISLRLDYWNIRHRNLVGIDRDDFIRRALAGEFPRVGQGLLPTGSPGVEVAASGFVTDAHFQLSNLGYQQVDGIDASYTHYLPETSVGKFSVLFDATYYLRFNRKPSTSAPEVRLAGSYLYPRLYATGKVRWRNGPASASITGRYTGGYRDDPAPRTLTALGIPAGTIVDVKSYLTFDLNFSYDIAKNSTVQLNVRNLFDRDPPMVLGSSANVDLFNHDLIGRFITVRFTQRF